MRIENISFENLISPVQCYQLKLVSIAFIVLFIICITFNSLLLWTFCTFKDLRKIPLNVFMIALTVFNLIGTLAEFPFVIVSNFYCRWMFDYVGCIASAFIMYFLGCTSVYFLVALSLQRYLIIKNAENKKYFTVRKNIGHVFMCMLLGVMWPILPLPNIEWSHYSLESSLTSCSVEWSERSFNVISYNLVIMLAVYFIPLAIIFYTNFSLIFMVRKLNMKIAQSQLRIFSRNKLKREKSATKILSLLIAGYLITWSPYAAVSMYSTFSPNPIDPLVSLLPSMFAKTSFLWMPIVYIISNKQIRYKIAKRIYDFSKYSSTNNLHAIL